MKEMVTLNSSFVSLINSKIKSIELRKMQGCELKTTTTKIEFKDNLTQNFIYIFKELTGKFSQIRITIRYLPKHRLYCY